MTALEIVRDALNKDEIKYILSGNETYLKSIGAEDLFKPDTRLYGTSEEYLDSVDIPFIVNKIEDCYFELDKDLKVRKDFVNRLKSSLLEMINDENVDSLYYLAQVYFYIAYLCSKKPFYPFKVILSELKKPLEKALIDNKKFLSNEKKFCGYDEGLFKVIEHLNQDLPTEIKLNLGV